MSSRVKPLLPAWALVPHSGESFIQLKVLASSVASAAGFFFFRVLFLAAGLADLFFPWADDAIFWPLKTDLETRLGKPLNNRAKIRPPPYLGGGLNSDYSIV